jgi:hypothetical protein
VKQKNSKIFSYTVGELKEILTQYPDNMPVIVSGYENGYENFRQPSVKKVKHLPENPYYDGGFQPDDHGMEALVLDREVRHD